jgi:hypothetical protein
MQWPWLVRQKRLISKSIAWIVPLAERSLKKGLGG